MFCIPRSNALSAIPCVVIEGFRATNAYVLSAGISRHITTASEKNGEHQNKYKSINGYAGVVSALLTFLLYWHLPPRFVRDYFPNAEK